MMIWVLVAIYFSSNGSFEHATTSAFRDEGQCLVAKEQIAALKNPWFIACLPASLQ